MPDRTDTIKHVRVFTTADGKGGNPAPIVLDAQGWNEREMMDLASLEGHESGFVFPASEPGANLALRFFVPRHEMEMCGHATVGALWCLRRAGHWRELQATVQTRSGLVQGFVRHAGTEAEFIEITQPVGRLQEIDDQSEVELIHEVLGLRQGQALPFPVLNAATSRIKTLIGVSSVALLDGLRPDFGRMEALCEHIGSTGLYPFAIESVQRRIFHARQFPKSSGYPEDAATGIAAAALLFGLSAHGLVADDEEEVVVHQGRAMGQPSQINVRFNLDASGVRAGCFVGGQVALAALST